MKPHRSPPAANALDTPSVMNMYFEFSDDANAEPKTQVMRSPRT